MPPADDAVQRRQAEAPGPSPLPLRPRSRDGGPARPPAVAQALGYAGLLPFAAGAAAVWTLPAPQQAWAVQGLAAYAALIATFLGGIHWGLAMRAPQPPALWLLWGVLPSLLVWGALLALPVWGASSALWALAATLLLCLLVDRRLYPAQGLGGWLGLRWRLTAVAALSCIVGAAGA